MTGSSNGAAVRRDALVVGFAMFAVFFGAGNLIFPPQVGFQSGAGWIAALAGMSLTGILLPVLAIIAVGLGGGSFEKLTAPVARWFGPVMIFVAMIVLGWLIALPRTASVAYETGFLTLVPGLDAKTWAWVFIPLYFAVTLYFVFDRSRVIDRIGRYLTPLLLVLLVAIVVWSVIAPLGAPVLTAEAAPFRLGFVIGYQTGDVFAGLMFGVIFIEAIVAKGYSEGAGFRPVLWGAGAVTFLGLFVVYGGLEYLGATGSGVVAAGTSRAGLLTALVGQLAGPLGATALAVAVLLACLTTAVGATAVLAEYVAKWSGGRIGYRPGAVIIALVAMLQAFGGVDYIIGLAGPIFVLFYPVGICIVILGLLPRRLLNDGVWKGAATLAVLTGAIDLAVVLSQATGHALPDALIRVYAAIPLSGAGFVWLVPSVLGAVAGGLLWKITGRGKGGPEGSVQAVVR